MSQKAGTVFQVYSLIYLVVTFLSFHLNTANKLVSLLQQSRLFLFFFFETHDFLPRGITLTKIPMHE